MEFYETVEKRRTIRDFEKESIPTEVIQKIIGAGLKAPSNDHMRDWHYIVIQDRKTAMKLLDVIPKSISDDDMNQLIRDWNLNDKEQQDHVSHLNGFASIWCSIENIFLAATAEGYGYTLRIPLGDESEWARDILQYPEDYFMPCFIGIGKPKKNAVVIKQKSITTEERIHWEGW